MWNEFSNFNFSLPWMTIGDFNDVIGQSEKSGGKPIMFKDVKDFNEMIAKSGLNDGGFSGGKFMWCNNRLGKHCILERIDRAMLNNSWISLFNTAITHLHRHCSYHSPLLVNIGPICGTGSFFKFINAWTKHHSFLQVVKETWKTDLPLRPLKKFAEKVRFLKIKLKK